MVDKDHSGGDSRTGEQCRLAARGQQVQMNDVEIPCQRSDCLPWTRKEVRKVVQIGPDLTQLIRHDGVNWVLAEDREIVMASPRFASEGEHPIFQ
jgi:hypothetical protein